jgi:hypothetical protein
LTFEFNPSACIPDGCQFGKMEYFHAFVEFAVYGPVVLSEMRRMTRSLYSKKSAAKKNWDKN